MCKSGKYYSMLLLPELIRMTDLIGIMSCALMHSSDENIVHTVRTYCSVVTDV